MPRFKTSKGTVRFRSPFMPEFQRLLFYELANAHLWNRETVLQTVIGPHRWAFEGWVTKPERRLQWTVSYERETVTVVSDEPRVYIRQGFVIDMGNGRLLVDANGTWKED